MTTVFSACAIAVATVLAADAPPFEDMPKVDVHAHYFDDMPEFAAMLERINMRVVVGCLFKDRPEMLESFHERAASLAKQYSPAMAFGSTFDLTRAGHPDFSETVIGWLERYFEKGAVMTKIWKEVGMSTRLPNGDFLMPDSPELDPIYAYLARAGKPLMAHFADPIEAWQPLTESNLHFRYFTQNPEWHMYGREGQPSHGDITASYDRMLARHPDLIVIGAHLGSLEHDLDALAARFDRFPNYHVDVSARTPDLRRYPPETIREFFIRYQDRILYGLDQGTFSGRELSIEEQRAYAERMEGWYRREYEYYAGEALNLPVEVLEKFYYRNAERILADLK